MAKRRDVSYWQQKLVHLKSEKMPNGCWEWKGRIGTRGYGLISVQSKAVLAHRYSFQAFKGPFDKSLFICHTCDNPGCVNPDHLFAGTCKDNTYDSIAKGRFYQKFEPGYKPPNRTIIDDAIIIGIKAALSNPDKKRQIREIAASFGVAEHIVKDIRRGRSYKNVG